MKPFPFEYEQPKDLDEVLTLLATLKDAKIIAGGQSLGPMLNLRAAAPSVLIDISRIEELRLIEEDDRSIVVGAAVRHAEFEDGRVPSPIDGIFPRVASGIAYRAVRNRGTVGGSLAHADPAADWPAVLYALGATARVRSARGARNVPISELTVGPLETCLADDEIIAALSVPKFSKAARVGRYKINKKPGDFAEATAIVVEDRDSGVSRIVVSGSKLMPTLLPQSSASVGKLRSAELDAFAESAKEELKSLGLSSYDLRIFGASVLRATKEVVTQ
jgi:carbon-monoxide dehydrogenase medium subunit